MHYKPSDQWLLPFLKRVHSRPGMYLGDENVRTLAIYIQAYGQAREDLGFPEFGFGEELLLGDFETWIARHTSTNIDAHWPGLVESMDSSARNAHTFFSLFEKFLSERGDSLDNPGPHEWPAHPWTPKEDAKKDR